MGLLVLIKFVLVLLGCLCGHYFRSLLGRLSGSYIFYSSSVSELAYFLYLSSFSLHVIRDDH